MTISIGHGKERSWKQSNTRNLITGVLSIVAAVAVVVGALLWQGSDNASTSLNEAPKPAVQASTHQEFVPQYYYLVNSEADFYALMADSDAEAFNHIFAIDMSKPESVEFLNLLNQDIMGAAEMGSPVSTFVIDAR
jgi:hypothetical protein